MEWIEAQHGGICRVSDIVSFVVEQLPLEATKRFTEENLLPGESFGDWRIAGSLRNLHEYGRGICFVFSSNSDEDSSRAALNNIVFALHNEYAGRVLPFEYWGGCLMASEDGK